mmetsp:Transcript_58441/g.178201  ORF Transcript_58441/g.178201 Transcript_58441/m.178201 type:complete len:96 (+) Transcript_58441:413-700(+)
MHAVCALSGRTLCLEQLEFSAAFDFLSRPRLGHWQSDQRVGIRMAPQLQAIGMHFKHSQSACDSLVARPVFPVLVRQSVDARWCIVDPLATLNIS